jgi:hypothetical protein
VFGRPSRLEWLGASCELTCVADYDGQPGRVGWLSGPSRATRVRGDEWLPREVTGKRSAMGRGVAGPLSYIPL